MEGLLAVLRANAAYASRLSLETGERILAEDDGMALLGRFSRVVREFGCRVGVDQFGRHFAAIPRLYEVKIDYIKIDGSFVVDIDENHGNQRFIEALVQVCRSLEIALYAERVMSANELNALLALGVAGATGPGVSEVAG
jgi:EAL domain-containing protein (putative c-di-GMP-specific phosphodiesterase class I)